MKQFEYFPNGQMKISRILTDNNYRQDVAYNCREYYPNGSLYKVKYYNSDKELSVVNDGIGHPSYLEYFENTTGDDSKHSGDSLIRLKSFYKNGVRHRDDDNPAYIKYHNNGRVAVQSYWKDGIKTRDVLPAHIECDKDGALTFEGFYDSKGKLIVKVYHYPDYVQVEHYDSDGAIVSKVTGITNDNLAPFDFKVPMLHKDIGNEPAEVFYYKDGTVKTIQHKDVLDIKGEKFSIVKSLNNKATITDFDTKGKIIFEQYNYEPLDRKEPTNNGLVVTVNHYSGYIKAMHYVNNKIIKEETFSGVRTYAEATKDKLCSIAGLPSEIRYDSNEKVSMKTWINPDKTSRVCYYYNDGIERQQYCNSAGLEHKNLGEPSYIAYDKLRKINKLEYRVNGVLHRVDGPAIEDLIKPEHSAYYLHGTPCSKEDYLKLGGSIAIDSVKKDLNNLDAEVKESVKENKDSSKNFFTASNADFLDISEEEFQKVLKSINEKIASIKSNGEPVVAPNLWSPKETKPVQKKESNLDGDFDWTLNDKKVDDTLKEKLSSISWGEPLQPPVVEKETTISDVIRPFLEVKPKDQVKTESSQQVKSEEKMKKTYWDNGNVKSVAYHNANGKLHNDNGPAFEKHYEDGNIESLSFYTNGKRNCLSGPAYITFYKTGQVRFESFWEDGIKQSLFDEPAHIEYYEDGTIRVERFYHDGEKDGSPAIIEYLEDGSIARVEYWKGGNFVKFLSGDDYVKSLQVPVSQQANVSKKKGILTPTFTSMIKGDAVNAGYRIASTQITNGVREGMLLMLRNDGIESEKIKTIAEMLDTEAGKSFVNIMLGLGLTYVPKYKDDARVERLAKEFRTEGIAVAGNAAITTTLDYIMPHIIDALRSIPEMESSKVRVEALAENIEEEVEASVENKRARA